MATDRDYDNRVDVADVESIIDRWETAARAWREVENAVGRARLNQPYGAAAREGFDLFYPAGRPEGLIVFVHGGYWKAFDRDSWSHLARGGVAAGWAVAVPGYTLAPEARISEMTDQIAAAVTAAAAQIPGPIRLVGHSAGGHLVARMACADTPLPEAVQSRLARVVPVSPVSDLRPLLELSMNEILRLDATEAEAESPVLHRPGDVPVTIWVGSDERPAFHDQARWLHEAWSGSELHHADGRHHFDVIEALEDVDSAMMRSVLA